MGVPGAPLGQTLIGALSARLGVIRKQRTPLFFPLDPDGPARLCFFLHSKEKK